MATNNTENVTAGKPKIGGSIFRAPIGTTLPTDAITALPAAFENLGYISEDGLTNANSTESEQVKDWGGVNVLTTKTSEDDTFKFAMIEFKRKAALQTYWGDDAVTGTDVESGLSVAVGGNEDVAHVYVVEKVLKGGVLQRTVIPSATVSEKEDIEYTNADAVGLGVTLACDADANGHTHYEYLQKAPTTTPPAEDVNDGE